MQYPEADLQKTIDDPAFCSLLRLLNRNALTWDTFLACPLPSGFSPKNAWDIVNKIGRCSGFDLVVDLNGNHMWYRQTHELTELVGAIIRRCSPESKLHQALFSHSGDSLITEMRIEESCATAQAAGLCNNSERLALQFRSGLEPTSTSEKLVTNMINLHRDLLNYTDSPFSRSLFDELRTSLLKGVSQDELDALFEHNFDEAVDEATWDCVSRQLDELIRYANHDLGEQEDYDVLRGLFIGSMISHFQPYGVLSPLLASLAMSLYFFKNSLPVLGSLPLTSMKKRWIEGEISFPTVAFDIDEYYATLNRCLGDVTFHQVISAQLVLHAIEEAGAQVEGVAGQDALMRELLNHDPGFNHRQRSILARAIRAPYAEFYISYHQRKHSIAYATARRDLVELKQKGYLRSQRSGKGFVFLPDAKIQEILD